MELIRVFTGLLGLALTQIPVVGKPLVTATVVLIIAQYQCRYLIYPSKSLFLSAVNISLLSDPQNERKSKKNTECPCGCHDKGIKHFYCCALFCLPPLPYHPFYSLENENDPEAKQGPRKEVHTKEYPFGLTVTTEITYKEVQPPLTRLLRRVVSFFVPNDDPPSEK